jgi:osmoprotectant transport system substrate-binding protein
MNFTIKSNEKAGTRMGRKSTYKQLLTVAAGALAAVVLAACGSSSSSSSTASSTSTSSASSTPAPTNTSTNGGTVTPASSGPGVGKPPVVIGDKNFEEEYVLGSLYQEALAAKGYKVTLKGNIGSSELTWKALTSGQIQMYPEYTGTLLTAIANDNNPPHSAAQTYALAQSYVKKHGYVLLNQTPFADSDVLTATKTFASAHGLTTVADLKKLGHSLKLGAAPEFATRYEGLIGLKKAYGLNPTFVPLAIGITYKAIDSGQVDVFDAFTTDPQLLSGKYTPLADPKGVFGFQNVAPVVKQSVLSAEGPAFAQTLNAVSALLTLPAIQRMNQAVAVDQQSPAAVAHQFLVANHLA